MKRIYNILRALIDRANAAAHAQGYVIPPPVTHLPCVRVIEKKDRTPWQKTS